MSNNRFCNTKLSGASGTTTVEMFFLVVLFSILSSFEAIAQADLHFDIFQQEDGLPNNQVQCIYQDSKGWMWIGTSQGLSRFDGYAFHNILPNPADPASLHGNLIRVIREDRKGNLLVGTENGGLNIYDRNKERFSHPLDTCKELNYGNFSVNDIKEDASGNLWAGTDFGIIVMDTMGKARLLNPMLNPGSEEFTGSYIRIIQFDRKGDLWIGTDNGVFIYHLAGQFIEQLHLPYTENQNREIWEIYLDSDGDLWIGTYASGLFTVDPRTMEIKNIALDPAEARTETVRSISEGLFGEFWIGTRGGLYKYSKVLGVTGFYRHDEREAHSLSNNSVLSVFQDSKGEIWIGTRKGLNLLAKRKQVFRNFGTLPGNNHYLNSSIVYQFWIDPDSHIWIGTEDGGINIYDPAKGTYEYITTSMKNGYAISQNCIKSFLDDANGNVWVGTFLGGVDVINLSTRKVTRNRYNPDLPGSLSDNRVWDICSDKHKNIWVVTSRGLDKYLPQTNSFSHYPQVNGKEMLLWIDCDSRGNLWMGSSDEIIVFNPDDSSIIRFHESTQSMLEDSGKRIWIATSDKGIALYQQETGPLKYYNESHGLSNNHALCILEDGENQLWVSTTNGLSRFNPEMELFQNFTSMDGLGSNQFCYGAARKMPDGKLLFGTVSGFNLFDPSEIVLEDNDVSLVFTELKIFNKSVRVSDEKNAVLRQSISETDELVLNWSQNVFTIEFAALNYVNSENNLYSYKLEGFNKEWTDPAKYRSATYTNLNPGDYTLRVKRVVYGNPEGGRELKLDLTILPPYWKTLWFLGIIILLILVSIYVLVIFYNNREKIKNQLVNERVNARRLHELDMLKIRFFTNISHEIRTPLSLILGPLEKMLNKKVDENEIGENLKLMHRNAINLNKLVNQLLDFRKLQTGNLKMHETESDLVEFIRNIVNSFNDFAIEKQVRLKFVTLKKRLFVSFDPDIIEKVLNNLLSNAFKFTESGESITVNLSLIFDRNEDDFSEGGREKQFVEISVKDTGAGIAESSLNKIFNRFFQAGSENHHSGVGIGLALVKELVTLHKGRIMVTSKPGKGTKFTIHIPHVTSAVEVPDERDEMDADQSGELPSHLAITDETPENLQSRIMLIIDDNPDVRQFIAGNFNEGFKTLEARNGEEGWELAVKMIPDIIISDIIMPVLDGYELCKRLKNDQRTSHIPVLLLTAMHSKDHELKGLTTGADDYITKPFDLALLHAKVENMLSIRESLREKYTGTMVLEPTHIELASPDELFIKKAIEVIEMNISDSDLDIESFSVKVGVSRMQLYRKLHALTNMTVKEFIRHIRLKRAAQMLVQQKMNVSEVAYEVGFKDLSHFRKCFKQEFGMSATEFINSSQKRTGQGIPSDPSD
ncbi:MAG: hypothetical protein A2X22_02775 [Bacteroidetes bacterium GWF2_49_14]|nr:MAG: hypothetical protein A2X22_02775 [Bacteroidetes bacterium GWF2_49_14]